MGCVEASKIPKIHNDRCRHGPVTVDEPVRIIRVAGLDEASQLRHDHSRPILRWHLHLIHGWNNPRRSDSRRLTCTLVIGYPQLHRRLGDRQHPARHSAARHDRRPPHRTPRPDCPTTGLPSNPTSSTPKPFADQAFTIDHSTWIEQWHAHRHAPPRPSTRDSATYQTSSETQNSRSTTPSRSSSPTT